MRKSSPRLKTSRQLRGQALVNLKKDLADHIATGSPTRLEILSKHGIVDNTYRKYMAQVDTTAPSTVPAAEPPTLSATGMTPADVVVACGFCVKRSLDVVEQKNSGIRDLETAQKVVLAMKEIVFGNVPILAIEGTAQRSADGEDADSIRTLEELYGFSKKS